MADVTDGMGEYANTTGSGAHAIQGEKFLTKVVCTLHKATKDADATCTKAYLYSTAPALLASAAFVGNDATFNYVLANATSYYIVADAEGGAWVNGYDDTAAKGVYPNVKTNVNFTACVEGWADDTSLYRTIISITTEAVASSVAVLQPNKYCGAI